MRLLWRPNYQDMQINPKENTGVLEKQTNLINLFKLLFFLCIS